MMGGLWVQSTSSLIDKVNQLREQGVAKREALVEGARSRLRPIVMTTMCTLFGFLPLALAVGEGAEVRSPMAIPVIGGLLVSTLLKDRKSVVQGKGGSVGVDIGGRRILKKKN